MSTEYQLLTSRCDICCETDKRLAIVDTNCHSCDLYILGGFGVIVGNSEGSVQGSHKSAVGPTPYFDGSIQRSSDQFQRVCRMEFERRDRRSMAEGRL